MASREYGTGKLICLLHGYAGSVMHWDGVVHHLQAKYRVVVPNMGHLYMGKEPLPFTHQVDLLARFFLLNYPGEKVTLTGMSYGGALAWAFAAKYPQMVEDVILVNPLPPNAMDKFAAVFMKSFFKLPLTLASVRILLDTKPGQFFLRKTAEVFRIERAEFWERFHTLKGRKLDFVSHVIYRFHWLLKNENWKEWERQVSQTTVPMCLIHSSDDPLFRPAVYDDLVQRLRISEVVTIDDAGHIPTIKKSLEVSEAIHHYLNKVPGTFSVA